MVVERVDDALLVEISRDLVREVAPQEMPLFRANSQAYLKDPEKVLRGGRSGDQLLGFGGAGDIALLTPAILAVASAVLQFIAAEAAKSAKQESAPIIHELVRSMFKKFRADAPAAPASLSQQQLVEVRQVAFETASRLNISAAQAGLLADSMVGVLAVH